MITSLVAMYQKGAITADHLVIQCLHLIDPADPAPVLGVLPHEIITRMREFIHDYRTGGMVTNYGVLPAVDQVEAAKKWIEANDPNKPRGSTLTEQIGTSISPDSMSRAQ
jgi:hypothetical protein